MMSLMSENSDVKTTTNSETAAETAAKTEIKATMMTTITISKIFKFKSKSIIRKFLKRRISLDFNSDVFLLKLSRKDVSMTEALIEVQKIKFKNSRREFELKMKQKNQTHEQVMTQFVLNHQEVKIQHSKNLNQLTMNRKKREKKRREKKN